MLQSEGTMKIDDIDISDLESVCADTPEEINMQITRNKYCLGLRMSRTENDVVVLTTGGTFDKEYPRAMGGYAFEFGANSGAERIRQRAKGRFTVESICKLDSQDMTNKIRDMLVLRIQQQPEKVYVVTHGTDTMIETALYLSNKLASGRVLLVGAKLPEVFKDTDAEFNLGVGIGAAKMMRNDPDQANVKICFHGEIFDPNRVIRESNGDFSYCV